jgi:hypothetical protein
VQKSKEKTSYVVVQAVSREDDHIVESIHLNMLMLGALEDQIN